MPHLYCIGDANGKMMLAHAASAQGISGESFYQYRVFITLFGGQSLKVHLQGLYDLVSPVGYVYCWFSF